ncbi:hypothetical protein DFJ74DRAFT_652252 [Hyaloraphidium curvatum]|nr:hypothetical protein DFJ74DRAFT_652252 [Hyaloraphidium curvatum]
MIGSGTLEQDDAMERLVRPLLGDLSGLYEGLCTVELLPEPHGHADGCRSQDEERATSELVPYLELDVMEGVPETFNACLERNLSHSFNCVQCSAEVTNMKNIQRIGDILAFDIRAYRQLDGAITKTYPSIIFTEYLTIDISIFVLDKVLWHSGHIQTGVSEHGHYGYITRAGANRWEIVSDDTVLGPFTLAELHPRLRAFQGPTCVPRFAIYRKLTQGESVEGSFTMEWHTQRPTPTTTIDGFLFGPKGNVEPDAKTKDHETVDNGTTGKDQGSELGGGIQEKHRAGTVNDVDRTARTDKPYFADDEAIVRFARQNCKKDSMRVVIPWDRYKKEGQQLSTGYARGAADAWVAAGKAFVGAFGRDVSVTTEMIGNDAARMHALSFKADSASVHFGIIFPTSNGGKQYYRLDGFRQRIQGRPLNGTIRLDGLQPTVIAVLQNVLGMAFVARDTAIGPQRLTAHGSQLTWKPSTTKVARVFDLFMNSRELRNLIRLAPGRAPDAQEQAVVDPDPNAPSVQNDYGDNVSWICEQRYKLGNCLANARLVTYDTERATIRLAKKLRKKVTGTFVDILSIANPPLFMVSDIIERANDDDFKDLVKEWDNDSGDCAHFVATCLSTKKIECQSGTCPLPPGTQLAEYAVPRRQGDEGFWFCSACKPKKKVGPNTGLYPTNRERHSKVNLARKLVSTNGRLLDWASSYHCELLRAARGDGITDDIVAFLPFVADLCAIYTKRLRDSGLWELEFHKMRCEACLEEVGQWKRKSAVAEHNANDIIPGLKDTRDAMSVRADTDHAHTAEDFVGADCLNLRAFLCGPCNKVLGFIDWLIAAGTLDPLANDAGRRLAMLIFRYLSKSWTGRSIFRDYSTQYERVLSTVYGDGDRSDPTPLYASQEWRDLRARIVRDHAGHLLDPFTGRPGDHLDHDHSQASGLALRGFLERITNLILGDVEKFIRDRGLNEEGLGAVLQQMLHLVRSKPLGVEVERQRSARGAQTSFTAAELVTYVLRPRRQIMEELLADFEALKNN